MWETGISTERGQSVAGWGHAGAMSCRLYVAVTIILTGILKIL